MLIKAMDARFRVCGQSPPPEVHILAEDMDNSYIGSVECRPFYRGADAVSAIATLGLLPSVLKATRLLVLWEERDLHIALEMPQEHPAIGMVILDARFDGHTLHWHPISASADTANRPEPPGVLVEWGTPARYENVALPEPIEALLQVWREFREDDIRQTVTGLEQAGYGVHWINYEKG